MNIPNNLPWKQADLSTLQDCIEDSLGYIVAERFGSDVEQEYTILACNKFPKVIELLNKILRYYDLDGEDYSDGEMLDLIKPDIEEFLNNLKE